MSDDAMHVRFTRSEIVMGTHQPRPRGCDRAKVVEVVEKLVAAVDQDARIDGPAYWISKRNALLACIQIAINEAEAAAVVESERCADKAMMRVITGQ
jgi:hypothetical protein